MHRKTAGRGIEDVSGRGTAETTAGRQLPALMWRDCEPVEDIETADIEPLLERIGDARLVLLGEASHGTSEFYRMRRRITCELIERAGFNFVAVEADWPDAALVDSYVGGDRDSLARPRQAFRRFPRWMWRNTDVLDFVEWLREHNGGRRESPVSFHGLDLYSLYESIEQVLRYLDTADPQLARLARKRYGCFTPYESDPAAYGLAALNDRYRQCEDEVVAMLRDLQERHDYVTGAGARFLDAKQNAQLVRNAESYYRAMYYGGAESWNLRDQHMFDVLQALLTFHGDAARGVVWAHNSHLGDARATGMAAHGEVNLGQLVREEYGDLSYSVGFGTHHGTVTAASQWAGEPQIMDVRPAHPHSYERLCHEAGQQAFLLPMRAKHAEPDTRAHLLEERLERAIGVVYRPHTELGSHYFDACLPMQFDEYCWFDATTAVTPLSGADRAPLPEDHPFATLDV